VFESDPFVPFTYSEPDSALRLEVQANDDGDNTLICRLVISYRAERHSFEFAVSMLRRMFREARASHWDRSGTIALEEPHDSEHFLYLRVYKPHRGEDWSEWAELDLARRRQAGKSRRRMTDHLISGVSAPQTCCCKSSGEPSSWCSPAAAVNC
jgi:hypothetical protein